MQILTSIIATVYELPTIVNPGDFHIFCNTVFFGNPKYIRRYDVSLLLTPTLRISHPEHYPNMLCKLFCHWNSDVRDYCHRFLVFRIFVS